MQNPSLYLDTLIRELSGFPGIGGKSASRLAFHLLKMTDFEVERLIRAITDVKSNIMTCSICGGISDKDTCSICTDERRETGTVCVVEHAKDMLVIENTGRFSGVYHVLAGSISPLDGIGPEDLNIYSLQQRCSVGVVKEVILATSPNVDGDATALYLSGILKPMGVMVTRIAHGLPVGSDLDYVDSATIVKSIEERREMK